VSKSKPNQPVRITKEDIENQLRSLTTDVKADVMSEKQKVITGGVIAVVVVLVLVFLIGKRSGRKKTTLVEIRRV
jgi:hypothetical protein